MFANAKFIARNPRKAFNEAVLMLAYHICVRALRMQPCYQLQRIVDAFEHARETL